MKIFSNSVFVSSYLLYLLFLVPEGLRDFLHTTFQLIYLPISKFAYIF